MILVKRGKSASLDAPGGRDVTVPNRRNSRRPGNNVVANEEREETEIGMNEVTGANGNPDVFAIVAVTGKIPAARLVIAIFVIWSQRQQQARHDMILWNRRNGHNGKVVADAEDVAVGASGVKNCRAKRS